MLYTSTSYSLVRWLHFVRLVDLNLILLKKVFYKPYESQGQAWPITFIRLIWGVVIFLLFMIGIFTLRKSYVLSSLLVPLLIGTVVWSWYVDKSLKPLSKYVGLSSVFEVQRGEETADVHQLRAGHPVTWSQR
jgi:calcium permeable stress-gated cation channel